MLRLHPLITQPELNYSSILNSIIYHLIMFLLLIIQLVRVVDFEAACSHLGYIIFVLDFAQVGGEFFEEGVDVGFVLLFYGCYFGVVALGHLKSILLQCQVLL